MYIVQYYILTAVNNWLKFAKWRRSIPIIHGALLLIDKVFLLSTLFSNPSTDSGIICTCHMGNTPIHFKPSATEPDFIFLNRLWDLFLYLVFRSMSELKIIIIFTSAYNTSEPSLYSLFSLKCCDWRRPIATF